jgi:hypothetical protein
MVSKGLMNSISFGERGTLATRHARPYAGHPRLCRAKKKVEVQGGLRGLIEYYRRNFWI